MPPVPIENLLIHAEFVRGLARDLVRDPHERDDLEQDAWLAAMRRPPAHGASLRGWFAALLGSLRANRGRDEQRRRLRELAASPPPGGADPADAIVAKEQVRQRLLAAVLRLPEPFRGAVLLRYYEELSPSQIAKRLGVPATTVRTRVARGLERLRAELDAEYGGERAAWALPLLAFPGAGSPLPLALPTVFAMKKTAVVVSAVLLAAASLVLAWFAWFAPPEAPALGPNAPARSPSPAQAEPHLAGAAATTGEAAGVRTAAEGPPRASPAGDAEPLGELVVTVVWPDEAPAAGVHVYAQVANGGRRPLATAVTDDLGQVRARVAAGRVYVSADRDAPGADGEVAAGKVLELRLKIEAGVDVAGVVRDARGAVVAGASVWLTSFQAPWCNMATVATSDAQGQFAVRCVDKKQSLGATAAGFGPSALVDLEQVDTKSSPVRIELVLADAGGVVSGRVSDEQGKPVAGARVAIGAHDRLIDSGIDGRMVEKWAPRQAISDADGLYRCECLAPGEHPVEVWANDYPFWYGKVAVTAGETAKYDIALVRGAIVRGIVTGEDGAPLAGAIVRAFPKPIDESFLMMGQYDYDSTFGYASAVADDAGRYRLAAAPTGDVQLYAGPRRDARRDAVVPWAHAAVQLAAGAAFEWNPKVEPGPTIQGVVRYRDGLPMPHSFVNLVIPGEKRSNAVTTDKQGRFRFVHLVPRAYDITVQVWDPPPGAPQLQAREVWPDRGEVVITATYDAPKKLAPGSVRGRIVDSGRRCANAATLRVLLTNDDRSWNTGGTLADGAFAFDDVEPGRKRVIVMSNEDPILVGESFELQPAEQHDCGVLTTQPGGKLRLVIVREPGTEAVEPTIYLRPKGSMHSRKVAVGAAKELELDNLNLGEHTVSLWHKDVASVSGQCTVRADETATFTITLRAAAPRELVLEYGADQRMASIEVVDAKGEQVWTFSVAHVVDRPLRARAQLPLGKYTFRVRTTTGGVAEVAFAVDALDAAQPPVVLQAK